MAEVSSELLQKAVEVAGRVGHALIATSDVEGWPHVGAARTLIQKDEGRIDVREWFCPRTRANLQNNPHVSVVVWEPVSDTGYQLLGDMEQMTDISMVDGYVPEVESKGPLPQVESQLLIHVDKVMAFKRAPHSDAEEEEGYVELRLGEITLHGNLLIPEQAKGVVAFAHGNGSSRHSPRNQYVAQVLRDAGLATLLFDLLTLDEEAEDLISGKYRFDISLLARRLVAATDWLQANGSTGTLRLGYFGASTGAAAALIAAAERPEVVQAVVSRGGRPDLAAPYLEQVKAPTLLIVGGSDFSVIDMNQEALAKLRAEKNLAIIPGATHLFEEPGALDNVAKEASDWFLRYLVGRT